MSPAVASATVAASPSADKVIFFEAMIKVSFSLV
jgi:hypothetical protein